MFALSRSIRNCFLVVALATLAGCVEDGPPLGPEVEPSFTVSSGRGGSSKRRGPRAENLISWDGRAWIASNHKRLGYGFFERGNVGVVFIDYKMWNFTVNPPLQ